MYKYSQNNNNKVLSCKAIWWIITLYQRLSLTTAVESENVPTRESSLQATSKEHREQAMKEKLKTKVSQPHPQIILRCNHTLIREITLTGKNNLIPLKKFKLHVKKKLFLSKYAKKIVWTSPSALESNIWTWSLDIKHEGLSTSKICRSKCCMQSTDVHLIYMNKKFSTIKIEEFSSYIIENIWTLKN